MLTHINNEDDFGKLYTKLSKVGAELLVNTIIGVFNNSLNPSKQNLDTEIKLAPKLNSENTRIDWNKPINKIIGQVKGLSPKPGAWTMIKNGQDETRMKILKAEEKEIESLEDKSVTVRDRDTMKQERVSIENLSEYYKKYFN